MTTIPSQAEGSPLPHQFVKPPLGQGEQRVCSVCGEREKPPEFTKPCRGIAAPPARGVRSEYDPMDF